MRLYREVDAKRAFEYADEKLRNGVPMAILAYIICQQSNQPAKAAIEIVETNKLEDRDLLALTFADALNQPQFSSEYLDYLKWCEKERSHQTALRESYAYHLNAIGEFDRSVEVAELLLKEDANNPKFLKLAGCCVQDKDPKKSLDYLSRELEITNSSDTLVRIARGHQLLKNSEQAIKHYNQALDLNPYETLAITNLVYAYDSTPKLFEQACVAIRHGYGDRDQYFLVVAVELAKKHKGELPEEWYPQALRRFQAVMNGDGYRDEHDKLRASIIAWAKVSKDTETLKEISKFWDRLFVSFKWPGTGWIPASVKPQT